MVGRRAAALSGCVLLAAACGGKTSKPHPVVLDRATASGKHASATASADATYYVHFSVAVTASPSQRVSGGWVVSCRVSTASSREADNFSDRTPFSVAVRASTESGGCTVIGTATLAKSGRVTVKVLGAQ